MVAKPQVERGGTADAMNPGLPQGEATQLNENQGGQNVADAAAAADAAIVAQHAVPPPGQPQEAQPQDNYQPQPVETVDPAQADAENTPPPTTGNDVKDFLLAPTQKPQEAVTAGQGLYSAPIPPNVHEWLPAFAQAAADPNTSPFIKGLYAAIVDQLNRG